MGTASRIELVVLDLAGTTVVDDGLVEEAFVRAWDRVRATEEGKDAAIDWVRQTMGQSKIEVFRHLVDEETAQALRAAFEEALDELVAEGRVTAIPGAEETVRRLRAAGRSVVFTTGFSRATADAVLASLGWQELAELSLTPADAGRGRPAPDLNLTALLRAGASSVSAIAVVGDTESDAESGVRAGAGYVAGVLTGGREAERLLAAGAHEVLADVTALPAALERHER
ncbi:HAD family hydrolase [Protaetiibacter larvae]|uniref:HAD hydrolase-like protein n=1 Tax=Protaetiibacter larvae TaxID=2592654 RepID=A0A5C1Y874_9MICO|nr:HAD family hydrolase [Protaetiibacter larvae]QEO09142.1 HAD hydrolase-like protein [Protaetiibacter larvae]